MTRTGTGEPCEAFTRRITLTTNADVELAFRLTKTQTPRVRLVGLAPAGASDPQTAT